jgi:excisionase family DNA binding protein
MQRDDTPELRSARAEGSQRQADVAGDADEASGEVIDVPAVARLLAVGRNTVYLLVARNEIPHRRLGKQIRFSRTAIVRWLASWSSQGAKEGH